MSIRQVLLVDDETDFVTTLAERLRLRGIGAQTVSSGEDALSELAGGVFDVMVLDVKMPGMDGLDLLRLVRKKHPDLPVILLSGHGSTRDGMEGMRLGASDYLVKPVDIEELMDRMSEAVARGTVQ
ncbi:MAG: response regulator [Desulfovibrionaceae bacterium]